MAGTLTLSTISDGTNSTSVTNAIRGSAKLWVNFNGQNPSAVVNTSYNVTSVTKNGSGDFTVNYTNALPSATYTVFALPCTTDFAGSNDASVISSTYTPTTTSYRFKVVIGLWSGSATPVNPNSINFIVFI